MKTSLFLSTAIGALLLTGVAAAAETPITFVAADLSGDNEVPDAVNSAATGKATLTFYPDTKKLCGKVTFNPTTFEYSLVHIHAGADGANGDPYVDLATDNGAGTITVNTTLTTEQATKLTTGESYVNVHTTAHGDGELRDQLAKDESATAEECEGGEEGDAGASSSSSSSSGGTGTGGGDAGKSSSSSSGSAATPDSTDDGGGCNTSGSHGADAAALLALGAIITAAARKRRNKKA